MQNSRTNIEANELNASELYHFGIVDIVCSIGERKIINEEIETKYNIENNYIKRRTGIEQRFFRSPETSFIDLALKSVNELIFRNKVKCSQIISVICTSSTYDINSPSLASRILNEIDRESTNEKCTALDINAACSGYLHALEIAQEKLYFNRTSIENKYILIVTNETFSDFIQESSGPGIIFGDASSATLVELSSHKKSNWKATIECIQTGSSRDLSQQNKIYHRDNIGKIDMAGLLVFEFAVKKMTKAILDMCNIVSINPNVIDYFILHQANQKIVETISRNIEHTGIFFSNIKEYGNTGATSIPLCLANIFESGIPNDKSAKAILSAFGFGFTHSAAYINIYKY